MLEFSHVINQQPLYYIYSEPINPIKSMRSKVPKMKLQRDKYILKSATCQLKCDSLRLIY